MMMINQHNWISNHEQIRVTMTKSEAKVNFEEASEVLHEIENLQVSEYRWKKNIYFSNTFKQMQQSSLIKNDDDNQIRCMLKNISNVKLPVSLSSNSLWSQQRELCDIFMPSRYHHTCTGIIKESYLDHTVDFGRVWNLFWHF